MMMQASNREIAIYDVVIRSLTGEFQLRTEVTKVDRDHAQDRETRRTHCRINTIRMEHHVAQK